MDDRQQPAVPWFVDACRPDQPCGIVEWHHAHDVALLQASEAALADDPAQAYALVTALLRLDMGQYASARSLLSLLVAAHQLEDTLAKVELLLARLPAAASANALREAVKAVDVTALDLCPLVIADYLVYVQAVDAVAGSDRDAIVDVSGPRWLFNRALTLRTIDAQFERRHAAAVEGDLFAALGGNERSPKQEPGWWLRNPVGDLLVDALHFDATSLTDDITESLATTEQLRADLLEHDKLLTATR